METTLSSLFVKKNPKKQTKKNIPARIIHAYSKMTHSSTCMLTHRHTQKMI